MGIIRASSATVASLYITFLAFVILCISNFVPANGPFEIDNFDYGTAFLLLSLSGLLSGFTSGDANDPFLRALLLCLCAMWGALGTFYITRDLTGPDIAPLSEALFPGYGAFFFIFLIFGFVCLQHQQFHTAVLALSLFLCCIFEIASLWRPVRMSVGSYYLLLGVMVLYMTVKMLVDKLQGKNYKQIDKRLPTENEYSNDYMAVGYAMDTIALTAFASHVTGITNIASNGFMWVGSAGIFQTICGLVAIRRKDPYYGSFFNLYGIFWCAVAFHLGLNYFSAAYDFPLLTVNIFFAVVFVLTSVIALTQELFHSIQNVVMSVFTISICVNGIQGRFLGGMGCVCFLFSLYGLAAHAGRLKQTRHKLPLGRRLFDRTQLKQYLTMRLSCCARFIYGKRQAGKNKSKFHHKLFSTNFSDMGYSKYIDLDTIGFAVNAVASLSVLWVPADLTLLTLPWVSIVGGVVQMMVGCICFGRGLTFESCAFIVFGTMWLILGTARSLGTLALDNSVAMSVCSIAYMITGLLLIGLSLVISKAWFLLTFLFELIALAFLLSSLAVTSYGSYEVIVVLLFAFVSLYCFLAAAFKSIWGRELLPTGTPIIQVSYLHSQGNRAFWAHAQKQSGVKAIAEIMNQGGIAGLPTDTVYVLAAAVRFPHAIERAYLTKKLAEDRPMSMWISNVNQLAAGREEFGEMLWDFMNAVWPSPISCVVSKGVWLDRLGIGYAKKYIGRQDSIAVRMPDNTVTSFLIDQTGPVATTSANPTGEADTTHHLQVLAKLGLKNCDGILCDGPSFANSASTVVDCRRIDEGKIGFFRIGLVPKSRVDDIFEQIQAKHSREKSISRHLSTHSISEAFNNHICNGDPENGGQINAAFEDDEKDEVNDNSDDQRFKIGKDSWQESNIHMSVSNQFFCNLPDSTDGCLMKSMTSLERPERGKRIVSVAPELNEAEVSQQVSHLIKNLEKLLNDSPGNNMTLFLESEMIKLIAKLQNRSRVVDQIHNRNEDDDYERMNFGGETNSIETPVFHHTLNKVFSIRKSSDDQSLASLKSGGRRELREEIDKFLLSRREKTSNKNKIINDLKNSSTGSYTTTLEINIDPNGHAQPTHPFDNQGGTAFKQKSSTPLLETIINSQKQREKETTSKKRLYPQIRILDNDLALLERENVKKLLRDQIVKSSYTGRPTNENGDHVYSFAFTDKFGNQVPNIREQPPSPSLEQVESLTQRTSL